MNAQNPHPRRVNPVLEVLFTSDWSALYDPISRERWELSALLDDTLLAAFNGEALAPDAADELSREGGLMDTSSVSCPAARAWCTANWHDPLRHYLHSNLLPKLSYAQTCGWLEDFSTMKKKVEESPIPPLTKRYDKPLGLVAIPLEHAVSPERRANLALLSRLLVTAFGISGSKRLAITGQHVRRTSPSGGSRHPTEAYAVIFDVEGLEPGVYHFDSSGLHLALIRAGQYRPEYMTRIAGLNRRIGFEPAAAFVLTSVVERSMHRYRDSRSYRVLHFDLGHLLQTLQMLARREGVSYFSAYSLGDSAAERLLGIDGLMETAMCQFMIGRGC